MNDTYQTKRPKEPTCWNCTGSGKMLGGGSVRVECVICDGSGFIGKETHPEPVRIDKRSKSYREAHRKLVMLGLTADIAHEKLGVQE